METFAYSRSARALHWVMAVLILLTVPAGMIMVQPGIDRDLQNALFFYHKNVGVLLLLLVFVRLGLRWRNPPPGLASLPVWQSRIAVLTHRALYALLVIVAASGYIRVRAGGFPIESLDALGVPLLLQKSDELAELAKAVHYRAGLAIVAVMALHVGAALFHGIVKRDGVFSRMWPPIQGRKR